MGKREREGGERGRQAGIELFLSIEMEDPSPWGNAMNLLYRGKTGRERNKGRRGRREGNLPAAPEKLFTWGPQTRVTGSRSDMSSWCDVEPPMLLLADLSRPSPLQTSMRYHVFTFPDNYTWTNERGTRPEGLLNLHTHVVLRL